MNKKIDLIEKIRLFNLDDRNIEDVEYTSDLADWKTQMEKVKTYDPFYYTHRANSYPSNKKNPYWKSDLSFDENQTYAAHVEFYSTDRGRGRAAISIGITITDGQQKINLIRGYFIGYKDPNYGKLIGISQMFKLLEELGIKKIIVYDQSDVILRVLTRHYDQIDPFQEKTAQICRMQMSRFDEIKLIKKILTKFNLLSLKEAEKVINSQMKSFLDFNQQMKEQQYINNE